MSKNIKSISNPKLKLEILTTEEIQKIHDATLWIIEHVGVRFPSQRALDIWEANSATAGGARSSAGSAARRQSCLLRN
jgi:trimethylamine--corrinoid protein Co-methyltransferase